MDKQEKVIFNKQVLLKADEVAKILNISLGLAYRLMKSGEIQSVKIHKAVRVRPEDLEIYIEKCLVAK